MKRILAVLVAALCFATVASASLAVPTQPKTPKLATHWNPPHPKGKWYMASSGHAIYCYGPVMIVGTWDGGFARVATACRGGLPMVKLKD